MECLLYVSKIKSKKGKKDVRLLKKSIEQIYKNNSMKLNELGVSNISWPILIDPDLKHEEIPLTVFFLFRCKWG